MGVDDDLSRCVPGQMDLAHTIMRDTSEIFVYGEIMVMRADVNIVDVQEQVTPGPLCHRRDKFPFCKFVFGKSEIA